MCYTVGPFWLSVLTIAVCTCQSQTTNLSLTSAYTLVTINSLSVSIF